MTPNANCTGSKSQNRSTCSNQTSDTSAACWVFSTSSRRPVFIKLQRGLDRRRGMHRVRQRDGVFHRELGAGADREMRGRLGVAEQHHVVLDPALAADHREIAPHRAVGQQRIAAEEPAENLVHPVGGLLFAQAFKAGALEGFGIGLENPGRVADFVLIGMRDERAPLGLLEDEGEGIERFGGAHPGELVGAQIDFRLEMIGESFAEAAVDAVGQHHQIGVGEAADFIDLGFEHQMNAEFARALLQDRQQHAPRAAAKPVAADAVHRAAEMHGDVVPIGEFLGDAAIARRDRISRNCPGWRRKTPRRSRRCRRRGCAHRP